MIITVRVKPKAHADSVQPPLDPSGTFIVSITQPPVDGKANKRVIELLADYFDVAKSLIEIKTGHTARTKIIEVKQ